MHRPGPAGWEGLHVAVDGLTLPHPRIGQRDFVLVPLADLVASEAVLEGRTPEQWLAAVPEQERTILRRVVEGDELLR
jgi:7,8-dihydro-6-hydroxymethylpterin-pyrophosphokinase